MARLVCRSCGNPPEPGDYIRGSLALCGPCSDRRRQRMDLLHGDARAVQRELDRTYWDRREAQQRRLARRRHPTYYSRHHCTAACDHLVTLTDGSETD